MTFVTQYSSHVDHCQLPPQKVRDDNNNNNHNYHVNDNDEGWDRGDKGTGQGFESQTRLEPQVRVFFEFTFKYYSTNDFM